jgi:hypothetical protein
MGSIVPILIIVVILAVGIIAILVAVIVGIHGDERHMSLADAPHSRPGSFARRVTGVHVAPSDDAHAAHAAHADARR